MANPDRPSGFTPVKSLWGAPLQMMLRSVGCSANDMYRNDALSFSSGTANRAASAGLVFGVAVGFGRDSGLHAEKAGMFEPQNLENRWFDTSAETNTEWLCYYIPAEGVIFEAQSASDLDLTVGVAADFTTTAGNATSGISGMELTTASNDDVAVVEIPAYPDNDSTLANTRYWVIFDTTAYLAESPIT
jgi:hypothetical protein